MSEHDNSPQAEADIAEDDANAGTRATGGVVDDSEPDQNTTTGTTPNENFVGRVSGQDTGAGGETGAERREAAGDDGRSGAADVNPEIQARIDRG